MPSDLNQEDPMNNFTFAELAGLIRPRVAKSNATGPVARRLAHQVMRNGHVRVFMLPAIHDPVLDVPTYLRRGLRIPGITD
jgi:hypothetical protein